MPLLDLCTKILIVGVLSTRIATAAENYQETNYATPEERQGALIRNLRSYEIDYPTITNGKQSHLGYLTDGQSRRRRKRAINLANEDEHFHYKFNANGEEIHMKLRLNKDLLGPNFKVEHFYGDDIIKSDTKMEEHCFLVGETIPHQYRAAISDCDGLVGVVRTREDMLYIEPLVNDSYVDKDKLNGSGRPHLIYRHSQLAKIDLGLDRLGITRIAPANSRRTSRRNIHFSFLTFINRSGRIIKLMWLDKRKIRTYFASLMPGTSRRVNTFTSHRWVAVDEDTGRQLLVGNRREYVPRRNTQKNRRTVAITLPRGLRLTPTSEEEIRKKIGEKYIEGMAVADKSVVDFHGKDRVARYILALMNVVSYVFKDSTIGFSINYVLVRIVLLHKHPKSVKLNPKNPNQSLLSACEYMNKIRVGRTDDDPKYHDHATFLTRKPFGKAAGYAPVYGMCHPVRSCTLNKEDGFPSAFIIAHETGHSLGMEHDGETNKCASVTNYGSIMAPLVQSRFGRFLWSSCSRKELLGSIRNFDCLNDKPGDDHKKDLPYLHRYPGAHYTTDEQCLFDFGAGYGFCRAFQRDPCKVLWCNMPSPYTHLCKSMRAPALNGTKCGEKKWCLAGRCVRRTEEIVEPEKVNGGWSKWKDWGNCSKTCGSGVRTRERKCDNPAPRNGGKQCSGRPIQKELCNIKSCEHTIPLRKDELQEQCEIIGKRKDPFRKWSLYKENKVNLNCTFERGFCSWINLKRDDDHDWRWHRGRTPTSGTGPSKDHTTNSARGRYIYFETSSPAKETDKAAIASPDLGVRRACLVFWYHMFGKNLGNLKVMRANASGRKVLWVKYGSQGDKWIQAQVNIREESLYNLVIQAQRNRHYLGDIALDDVTFTLGPCDKKGKEEEDEDPPNPCLVSCQRRGARGKISVGNKVSNGIRCYQNSSQDVCFEGQCRNVGCDNVVDSTKEFDKCGVCGGDGKTCEQIKGTIKRTPTRDLETLLNVPMGAANLDLRKSPHSNQLLVLSVKDAGKPSGVSYVINGNNKKSPPAIYYGGGTHYMYTNDKGQEAIKSFGVVKKDVTLQVKTLKRRGRRPPVEVQYEYYASQDIKMAIRKDMVKNSHERTTVRPHLVNKSGPRWVILNTWTPCSYTCGGGFTLLQYYCERNGKVTQRKYCKDIKLNVKARFKRCNTQPCEKKYKWIPGSWSACSKTCSVGIKTRSYTCVEHRGKKQVNSSFCKGQKMIDRKACVMKKCPPTWSTGNWRECSVPCGIGSQTRDVFCTDEQNIRASGCDKNKRPKSRKKCLQPACASEPSNPLDCDFENDFCAWKQMKDDDFDWQRHHGKTKSSKTGPKDDHTYSNRSGHYILMEASDPQKQGHQARLISPKINVERGCLTFFYHMWGEESGVLKVKFLTPTGFVEELSWERRGDQGQRWIKAEVDASIGPSYQIVIEATRGKGWQGDMAIDDIAFQETECDKQPKKLHDVNSGRHISAEKKNFVRKPYHWRN